MEKIVITGGPCAGKTTGMARIIEALSDRGWNVFVVPEAATLLINGGIIPDVVVSIEEFQTIVFDTITSLEQTFEIAARESDKPAVMLCDRGILDSRAYVDEAVFRALMRERNFGSLTELCEQRYDAVLHMRTAAYGAEASYTLTNNAARTESLEEARELDDRTLAAWHGHDHHRVIGNEGSFDQKLNELTRHVYNVLGIPVPVEIERKFVLAGLPDLAPAGTLVTEVHIQQQYLLSSNPDEVVRVRERVRDDGTVYFKTVKRQTAPGVRSEVERIISKQEYFTSLRHVDPRRRPIQKRRFCFFWQDQFFELDVFEGGDAGLVLLEIELLSVDQQITIPRWLGPYTEVTDDPRYSNYDRSRIA